MSSVFISSINDKIYEHILTYINSKGDIFDRDLLFKDVVAYGAVSIHIFFEGQELPIAYYKSDGFDPDWEVSVMSFVKRDYTQFEAIIRFYKDQSNDESFLFNKSGWKKFFPIFRFKDEYSVFKNSLPDINTANLSLVYSSHSLSGSESYIIAQIISGSKDYYWINGTRFN